MKMISRMAGHVEALILLLLHCKEGFESVEG